jgi:short-chain fatty acids transporter
VIGHWFVAISNGSTFPPIVYLYSTILNYFIPSGGSKWIVEAPYIVSAGKELGVSMTNTVVPYMYGDMTSNLIQPFWALPLIGLTNLKFRDIIGYCFFYFIVTLAVILVLLFILPAML